jgi:hypothetical protein
MDRQSTITVAVFEFQDLTDKFCCCNDRLAALISGIPWFAQGLSTVSITHGSQIHATGNVP